MTLNPSVLNFNEKTTVRHDTKYSSLFHHAASISLHSLLLTTPMTILKQLFSINTVARCSSVVRAFAHGAMCRRIDPSWAGPIELFLVPASAPRLGATKAVVCAILSVAWCI